MCRVQLFYDTPLSLFHSLVVCLFPRCPFDSLAARPRQVTGSWRRRPDSLKPSSFFLFSPLFSLFPCFFYPSPLDADIFLDSFTPRRSSNIPRRFLRSSMTRLANHLSRRACFPLAIGRVPNWKLCHRSDIGILLYDPTGLNVLVKTLRPPVTTRLAQSVGIRFSKSS